MEFPLHAYLRQAPAGASTEYIQVLRRAAQPLVQRGLPVLFTYGHIAHVTGIPSELLLRLASRAMDPYRVFPIRKRSGGLRHICAPVPELGRVQRWVQHHILNSDAALRMLSPQSMAYAPGRSHVKNATRHLGAEWILRLDISRFFEAISERQVYQVFRDLGYGSMVAFVLCRICTRVLPLQIDGRHFDERSFKWSAGPRAGQILQYPVLGHLPQGAPTSPMLANLVCRRLDQELSTLASDMGLVYTRYSDDMVFSGDFNQRQDAQSFLSKAAKLVLRNGFVLNQSKTAIKGPSARRIVTGLTVGGDKLKLPRPYKHKIRQELHYLATFGLDGHCARIGAENRLSYLQRLFARIRYVRYVEPSVGESFLRQLHAAVPGLGELQVIARMGPS